MYPELVNLTADPAELDHWFHANWDEHFRIIAAIKQQRGVILNILPIQSASADNPDNWLFAHQTLHDDMNQVLGIAGNDLLDVDFKNEDQRNAWAFLHMAEHVKATAILGI